MDTSVSVQNNNMAMKLYIYLCHIHQYKKELEIKKIMHLKIRNYWSIMYRLEVGKTFECLHLAFLQKSLWDVLYFRLVGS